MTLKWIDRYTAIAPAGFRYSIMAPNLTGGWRAWVGVVDAVGRQSIAGLLITSTEKSGEAAKLFCEQDYAKRVRAILDTLPDATAALTRSPVLFPKFSHGDRVMKVRGSSWHGTIVGTYQSSLTTEGYAVESELEAGSVQIFPADALVLVERGK
jgi:hypothetical protein